MDARQFITFHPKTVSSENSQPDLTVVSKTFKKAIWRTPNWQCFLPLRFLGVASVKMQTGYRLQNVQGSQLSWDKFVLPAVIKMLLHSNVVPAVWFVPEQKEIWLLNCA